MRVRNVTPLTYTLPSLGIEIAPGEEDEVPDSACCAALRPVDELSPLATPDTISVDEPVASPADLPTTKRRRGGLIQEN